MRSLALLACLASLVLSRSAEARLFRQTYGATVPTADGGCTWNPNQDYFVPRSCDTGQYGLYSSCKKSHYLSPACARLHPLYEGYCSPYAGWHYLRRDHVYAKHCGCTPLACERGPWRLDKCRKGCFVLRSTGACGPCPSCNNPQGAVGFCGAGAAEPVGSPEWQAPCDCLGGELPHVEPLAGAPLGKLPIAMLGASRMGGGATAPIAGTGAPNILPMMGVTPAPSAGGMTGGMTGNPWPPGF